MAKGITDRKHYDNIADAIRSRNGSEGKYKPSGMADAILALAEGCAKVSAVNIYDASGMFAITYNDGSMVTGSATFDENGLPTSLTDDNGNSVTFASGYPISATDKDGNTVPIIWG